MARKNGEDADAEPQAREHDDATADDDDDATDEHDPTDADSGDDSERSAGGPVDISDTPAPSVGPKTTFEREDPETRLARHEQSDKDAMGLDKRREVIGGTYGPTWRRQLAMYGLFVLCVGVIVAGFLIAVNKLDQPEAHYKDEAPWSQADAKQIKPPPIDFPNYGHPGPGEGKQATPGEQQGAATSENNSETASQ